jgi:hypothetical protein
LECLARFLEDIINYFNQWAYCYVGIYGFSYLESGRKVWELFEMRGWTAIVTNNLVGYTLGFTTFVVGLGTGGLAAIVEGVVSNVYHDPEGEFESYIFGPAPAPKLWALVIGFLIGIWVCSVIMNVVRGAVNTVSDDVPEEEEVSKFVSDLTSIVSFWSSQLIVCWADSPAKIESQHPALTAEMAEAWTSVFPEVVIGIQPTIPARVV